MKNLYSRLTLTTSVVLITGYLIVSATWTSMGNVGTGDQLSATLWNTLLDNTRDLNTRVQSVSSVWPSVTGGVAYTGGNVGIGAVPQTTLSIYKPIIGKTTLVADSHVYLRGSDNGYGLALGVSNSATAGFLQTKLNDVSATLPLLLNPDGGNVGIGTMSPSVTLDVQGSIASRFAASIQNNSSSTGAYSELQFGDSTGARKAVLQWTPDLYTNAPGNLSLVNLVSGKPTIVSATNGNIILSPGTGNVGIGTTSPIVSRRLTIRDGSQATRLALDTDAGQSSVLEFFENSTRRAMLAYDVSGKILSLLPEQTGSQVAIWSSNQERMRIDGTGNVGIGTTTPSAKFHITDANSNLRFGYDLSPGSGGPSLMLETASNVFGDIIWNTFGANQVRLRGSSYGLAIGGANPRLNIGYPDTNSSNAMVVNGNVGIGTPSPSTKLDTVGNIRNSAPSVGYIELSGDLPGYGANTYPTLKTNWANLYFSVGWSYSAYMTPGWVLTAISDKNKKENFRDLDYREILDKIDAMPLKEWNYKMEDRSIRHIGPFAQDFHALFGLNGPDDKMISNMDPTGVALAGIKGLSEKGKAYESQIADLKTVNTALQEKLDTLQSLVCFDHPTAKSCK